MARLVSVCAIASLLLLISLSPCTGLVPCAACSQASRRGANLLQYIGAQPPGTRRTVTNALAAANRAQWRRPSDAALLAALLRPLRRLLATLVRVVGSLARRISGKTGLIGASAIPNPLPGSAATIESLQVVEGVATRDATPPDEMLGYFGYNFSPFYMAAPTGDEESKVESLASIDQEATEAASGAARRAAVRWLRCGHARELTEFESASDDARLRLLRELYADAVAEEQLQRNRPPWAGLAEEWRALGFGGASLTVQKQVDRDDDDSS